MRKAQLRVPKSDTYVGHNLAAEDSASVSSAVPLYVQDAHRLKPQGIELRASMSKEGEDEGL